MKEIFTAKSIEEAKHLAAEKFGVSEDQIVYRILEEPKKGLFGKIKREAQVEAVYEEPAAAAAPETPAAPVSQPVQEVVSSVEEIVIDKDDNSPTRGMESEAIEDILTEENMTPGLLRARQYIADIYAAMGITVTITTMRTANGIRMELRSDNKSGTNDRSDLRQRAGHAVPADPDGFRSGKGLQICCGGFFSDRSPCDRMACKGNMAAGGVPHTWKNLRSFGIGNVWCTY